MTPNPTKGSGVVLVAALLLTAVFAAGPAVAQDSTDNEVTVTVTDEAGNTLSGIDVELANETAALKVKTTGDDGTVTFSGLNDSVSYSYLAESFQYETTHTIADAGDYSAVTLAMSAKPTYDVTATVVDQNGSDVAGADVTAVHHGTKIGTVTTDENGTGVLSVPAGEYKMSVSATGYEDALVDMTVTDTDNQTVDVSVTKSTDTTTTTTTSDDDDVAGGGGSVGDSDVYYVVGLVAGLIVIIGTFASIAGGKP